jgi:hypothetical protein
MSTVNLEVYSAKLKNKDMLSKRGFISTKPFNFSDCIAFEFQTKHDEIKLNAFYS